MPRAKKRMRGGSASGSDGPALACSVESRRGQEVFLRVPQHSHRFTLPSAPLQRVALCDFFHRSLADETGKVEGVGVVQPSQFVLESNAVRLDTSTGDIIARFELSPVVAKQDKHELLQELSSVVAAALKAVEAKALQAHIECVEDQEALRQMVMKADGVAFVGAGAACDLPLPGAVPFTCEPQMEKEFILPHRGAVRGSMIQGGVNLIVGGGFHGKSTLIRAIAAGVYNKVQGDGRELVVADPSAVSVRAEDGRYVGSIDISAFMEGLPEAVPVSPSHFSTQEASGSTSQAANLIEALEAGSRLLLMDEDTCAANIMTRDSRMRAMVHYETISPVIYRVNALWFEHNVSTIIVIGGNGDWFDVHTGALMMHNFAATDVTARAHSISKRFCNGRVQYAGRGLVHRLKWPETPAARCPCASSLAGLLGDDRTGLEVAGDAQHPKLMVGTTNKVTVDLSKLEQLHGGMPQVRGCGLALLYINRLLQEASSKGTMNMTELLDAVDKASWLELLQAAGGAGSTGAAARPRRFEVQATLCRLPGVVFGRQQGGGKDCNGKDSDARPGEE